MVSLDCLKKKEHLMDAVSLTTYLSPLRSLTIGVFMFGWGGGVGLMYVDVYEMRMCGCIIMWPLQLKNKTVDD